MMDVLSGPEASSSSSCQALCSVCNCSYSKYTCPRCSFRTCSLACSAAHKTRNSCSGIRDRAKYIPMNKYGWGAMMEDYVFLEDVGRQVGSWGRDIAVGGLETRGNGRGRGMRRGRGNRGAGRQGTRTHEGKTKRDILRVQLDYRDIEIEMLSEGMEKRKQNQSSWDSKNKTIFLTIEFMFHPPVDPLGPSSTYPSPTFTLLTHRNSIDKPLLSLIRSHVVERNRSKKDDKIPAWTRSLVHLDTEDPEAFTCPQCFIKAKLDPLLGPQTAYNKLDPTQKLSTLLQHTHFVEFPTIEVWEEGAFSGTIVNAQGTVTRSNEGERIPKRRKLDVNAGKKAIAGLLGEYGSEDEGPVAGGGLTSLGEYAASDEDGSVSVDTDDEEDEGVEDGPEDEEDSASEEDVKVDPATLLDLMKQAGALDEDGDVDLADWDDDLEQDKP